MAMFIPEWARVSARHVHLKRSLSALDDDHVVRRPLRPKPGAPDLFVQHQARGWLALAVEDARFAELDAAQLFESEPRERFEQRLAALQQLGASLAHAGHAVEPLVLMWACSTEEVQMLSRQARFATRLISREQFMQAGNTLIDGLLTPLADQAAQWLLGTYFPEAEITAVCTPRRAFARDNRARLQRLFLDHEQEWAAKLDLELPAEQAGASRDFSVRLVNGVAGSGKTLIALNRALLLAELFPRQCVLVLIHNTPIVADIKERLHRARGKLPANLEIHTFFSWVVRQWQAVFNARPNMPEGPRMLLELVRSARLNGPEVELSNEHLIDELDFINEALIPDQPAYLEASRSGRGFALRPKERARVWALYEAVNQMLHAAGLRIWSALPREICLAGQAAQRLRQYHYILVDEAQFFAPSWFQVVKLSMPADGQLFMCADPNQGFMRSRLSWKSVGLDVAGRTKKLRRSYRTTRAILQAANSVLDALGSAGSAGSANRDDYLEPDFSAMEAGKPPLLIYTDSPQDAMDRVVNEVAEIAAAGRLSLNDLLVIYGDNAAKASLYNGLCHRLGADSVWWFNEKNQKRQPPQGYGPDYLRMAYLDTATGLEARVVFLLGIEALWFAGERMGLAEEEQAQRREDNARRLYMAMTRAKQRLVLVSSRKLEASMERLFECVA
jgi:hypothetical protein